MKKTFISNFKNNNNIDPIYYSDELITIIKLYKKERVSEIIDPTTKETKIAYKTVERDKSPKFLVLPNKDKIDLDNYINIKNFSLNKNLKKFLDLQSIDDEVVKLVLGPHQGYFIDKNHLISNCTSNI